MEEEFERFYMYHINRMTYLGCWTIESKDPVKRLLYNIYSALVTIWVLFMSYMGLLDLIASIPNLEKIFYNTSFNPLIFCSLIKAWFIIWKAETVNNLGRKLFHSVTSCKDEEELAIYNSAVTDIKLISRFFSAALSYLYPFWLLSSLLSDYLGERRLPLPAKWPGEADLNDLWVFIPLCLFHGVFALLFMFEILSLDITTFGLLIQLYREYRFLIKQIREFGEYCDRIYMWDGVTAGKNGNPEEINVFLKRAKVKQMMGDIIIRQKQLIQCTEELEMVYYLPMFIHIFIGGAFLVVNGVQSMILSFQATFNVNLGYHYGYVFAIVCDMLYFCWLTNRVSIKCVEVGLEFYGTPWYAMDLDIQKDIVLVMLRCQKPPRVTSGKFVELNLSTFMGMMKNIYSWLALFRQVALK